MPRSNAYVLRNLGVPKKIGISLGLLSGLALFLSGWLISVVAINWAFTWMTVVDWGIRVGMLQGDLRWLLFGAHVISLALLLPLSLMLVRRMPLPRLTRRALFSVATALSIADLSAWLLLPFFSFERAALGGIVLVLALLLGYLVGAPLRAMWQPRSWREPETPVRVVVVGGGFAGLDSAVGLDRVLGWSDKLELTVIDRKNYFLFPPLLPSVSVGAIETRQVTYPFRRIFEATNIRFKKETVERIDLERNVIISKVDVDAD
ncbi:MAG TPA: hypothetical protein VHW01_13635, partial [Polyangiaceae bacterium]|nr:hypothetical protein [Polyangiaceae bacterium]